MKKHEPYEAAFDDRRLRVFDLMTAWFWIVCFYQPRIYGDAWFVIEIFEPTPERKRWWYFWRWEYRASGFDGLWQPLSKEGEAEAANSPLVNESDINLKTDLKIERHEWPANMGTIGTMHELACKYCQSDLHPSKHCPELVKFPCILCGDITHNAFCCHNK